jgi:phenylalanyl-tRNA synthetase beta chain
MRILVYSETDTLFTMKLSLDWLGDFVTFTEKDPYVIAAEITARVAEVDDIEVQGALLQNCCVGKVLSVEKHPGADKLKLSDVRTDRGVKRVVCGGTNLRVGMRVAFAHVGATVRWHGSEMQTLQSVKIRGEDSDGMICAAEELDLADRFPPKPVDGERPIVDLGDGDEDVGKGLRPVLGCTDTVLHIDNHAITHRADLFSHIGFARECVAVGLAQWKKEPKFTVPKFPKDPVPFDLHIESNELMPRYCACVITIDGLGETPAWMLQRLHTVGWRSVNLPVDITNYVATEVGVPLHSFDLDDLKGDIHMRGAKAGEKIVTLDGKEWALPAGALVLSDTVGIFDMLGIMGGLRSSTKASTHRIYLHSASLDPVSIRRTVIATGHRTDAATVYEKGVPHLTTEQGFLRAVELFLQCVPGAQITSRMASVGTNGAAKAIPFSAEHASRVLGVEIPEKTVRAILSDLGCAVKQGKKGTKGGLSISPPLWRLKDLQGPHDLVEEIGRIYGYNDIPVTVPEVSIAPPARDQRMHMIRDALKSSGHIELQPLSLLGPELLRKCNMDPGSCASVANAIGEEFSLLQPCVLPRLLDHAERNMLIVENALQTFHWGNIFDKDGSETLAMGILHASRADTSVATDPFLCLKRDVAAALAAAGYLVHLQSPDAFSPAAHPGRSAKMVVGDVGIGKLFDVHPGVRSRFDLPHRAAAVLLNLDALFARTSETLVARPVPQYPAITYDVTLTLDRRKALEGILDRIRTSSQLLESVHVADVYSGKPLTVDQYNVTLRCTYRAADRTLTEEEVKKEHGKIEQSIR